MKVVTIVGARPQFIKAGPVSAALKEHGLDEVVVDTGQHYDDNMAGVFFRELGMPPPAYSLSVGSGLHGAMTGRMLEKCEDVLLRERPDAVLVYGDTNSTLAGALAGAKLKYPVVHIEAGLRLRGMTIPEEINRRVTDHVSTILFCPTASAVENLKKEGIAESVCRVDRMEIDELPLIDLRKSPLVLNVGDVMADVLLRQRATLPDGPPIPGLVSGQYGVVTLHRAEATDDRNILAAVIGELAALARAIPLVLPLHPRTRAALAHHQLTVDSKIQVIDPLSYREFLCLLICARFLVTDSGGAQKEACMLGIPCLTLRDETEWMETIESGWNLLVGSIPHDLISQAMGFRAPAISNSAVFGNGTAAKTIAAALQRILSAE